AARRAGEAGQQADQRGLARAVRAQEAVDPAGRQREVDAVDGVDAAEPLPEAHGLHGGCPCRHRAHAVSPSSAAVTSSSTAAWWSIGSGTMLSIMGRVIRWKKIGPTNACRARIGCIGRIRPIAIWPVM